MQYLPTKSIWIVAHKNLKCIFEGKKTGTKMHTGWRTMNECSSSAICSTMGSASFKNSNEKKSNASNLYNDCPRMEIQCNFRLWQKKVILKSFKYSDDNYQIIYICIACYWFIYIEWKFKVTKIIGNDYRCDTIRYWTLGSRKYRFQSFSIHKI